MNFNSSEHETQEWLRQVLGSVWLSLLTLHNTCTSKPFTKHTYRQTVRLCSRKHQQTDWHFNRLAYTRFIRSTCLPPDMRT